MLAGVLGRKDTGEGAREPLAAYRRDEPETTNAALFGEVFTHYVQIQATKTAEAKLVGSRAPVYAYLFSAPPRCTVPNLPICSAGESMMPSPTRSATPGWRSPGTAIPTTTAYPGGRPTPSTSGPP